MPILLTKETAQKRKSLRAELISYYNEQRKDGKTFTQLSTKRRMTTSAMLDLVYKIESLNHISDGTEGWRYIKKMRPAVGRILFFLCPVQLMNLKYDTFYDFLDTWDDYMREQPMNEFPYNNDDEEGHPLMKQVNAWYDFSSYMNDYDGEEMPNVYGLHEPATLIIPDIFCEPMAFMWEEFTYETYNTESIRPATFKDSRAKGLHRVSWA